jgi:hypothetical protein
MEMYRASLLNAGLLPEDSTKNFRDVPLLNYSHPNTPKFDFLLQYYNKEYEPVADHFRLDDRKPKVFVLDGEGWKRRQVFTTMEKSRLWKGWHFTTLDEGLHRALVYWKWRPVIQDNGKLPWTDMEVLFNCKEHKLWYAPLLGFSYDTETGWELWPKAQRHLSLSELTQEAFEHTRAILPIWEGQNPTPLPTSTYSDPHYHMLQAQYAAHCWDKRARSLRRATMELERSPSPYRWEQYLQQDRGRMA